MIGRFWSRLTGIVHKYVAPIYYLAGAGGLLIAAYVTLCNLRILTPVPELFFRATARTWELTHSAYFVLLPAALAVAVVWAILVRNQHRHTVDQIRECLVKHLEYTDKSNRISHARMAARNKERELSMLARMHATYLCSRLAEISGQISGRKCHVTAKSLDQVSGHVKTRARDALLHNTGREVVDEEIVDFPYVENTAYERILGNHGEASYINNCLWPSKIFKKYENKNSNFWRFYSSTAVFPITLQKNPKMITRDSTIGFLCIDNKYGRFNKRLFRSLGAVFSLLLYETMLVLGEEEEDGTRGANHG